MESKLPTDKQARKEMPIASGVLDYFPLAIAEIAHVSYVGNQQHNPGEPMHWSRHKSTDHGDCIARHLVERGKIDTDGVRHTAKMAWRALALLQIELEKSNSCDTTPQEWKYAMPMCSEESSIRYWKTPQGQWYCRHTSTPENAPRSVTNSILEILMRDKKIIPAEVA